jgi:superfamily II DNA or RNA helicase
MLEPHGWQKEALRKFRKKAAKAFLLEATPGAGKTIFSALAAKALLDDGVVDFMVVVVPTTALKGDETGGFLCDWNKAGIQLTTVLKEGRDAPKEFQGGVITYQQLPNIITTFETWVGGGKRIGVVFDEIHHASDNNIWGAAAERLGSIAASVLGMTGTPFRGDRQRISFVQYNDEGNAVADHAYRYSEAVSDRVCRPVVFMTDDGFAEFVRDDEDVRVRLSEAKKDDDVTGASRTIFRKDSQWLGEVIIKADAKLDEYRAFDLDAGGIVICRPGLDEMDDRHLHQVAKLVRELTGEMPEVITHDDPEANTKIARFRKGSARWICSVRKISEGVDIKRLRVMVMANRPSTELLFRQLVGRVVRVDDRARPGDATVYVAKFPQLCQWAERIREEAEAGLKTPKERTPGEHDEEQVSDFRPIGSSHEDGGAISDFGESFFAVEIVAAEHLKANDPQLADVNVTQIAHLMRKLGVAPPQEVIHGEPLQVQKKKLRTEINRLQRRVAIERNPREPDFQGVWAILFQRFGVRSLDDLMDNKPIQVMRQVEATLKEMLVNRDAAA